jgi:hypothetical protein
MKSIVGLLEYTVTGAFVWMMFAAFLTMVTLQSPRYANLTEVWSAWSQSLPAIPDEIRRSAAMARELISAAIGGAFFVAIFATGALLDLLAPVVFVVLETRWSQKWMFREPRPWLDRLMSQEGELVAADYANLVRQERARPVEWEICKYRRVTTFLLSYVLAKSKSGQVDDLLDRLKLWRTNQAIALSLLLMTTALTVWILATWQAHKPVEAVVIGVLIPAFLFALSYFSMRMTFFRLVTALESAAYLGFTQSSRSEVKNPDDATPPVRIPTAVNTALAGKKIIMSIDQCQPGASAAQAKA